MAELEPVDALIRVVAPEGPAGEEVDAGVLLAFRAGTLDPERAEAVAATLVDSPAARAQLAALAAPVPEALIERMTEALPGHRRRSWWAVGALAAAAGILVGVLQLRRPLEPPPPYETGALSGALAETRGAQVSGRVFLPRSPLEWTVRPRHTLSGMLPLARAFIARPGGPLSALPAGQLRRVATGAYTLAAPAGQIFGDRPGRWLLVLALGRSAERLERLAGARVEDAPPDIGLVIAPVELRRAPPREEEP